MNTHPPISRIAAYAAGRLGEADMDELEAHLAGCGECAARLENHTWPGEEPLLALLRVAADSPTHTGDEKRGPVEQAIAEVRRHFAGHPQYELEEYIGGGGMGLVFAGRQASMGRRVAVKAIDPVLLSRREPALRFGREATALARLNHPNIVTAIDAGVAGPLHFLVMELLDGADLGQLVEGRGPLPIPEALAAIGGAAAGLGHAHDAGVLHRDVKPGNIFVPAGGGPAKVLDFGLASLRRTADAADDLTVTRPGAVLGTFDTLAPEQLDDPTSVDRRADVFGLGCALYFAVTGVSPYRRGTVRATCAAAARGDAEPIRSLRPEVPDSIARLAHAMIHADRARRPADMTAVREALTAGPPAAPPTRRVAIAAGLAAVAGVAAWYGCRGERGTLDTPANGPSRGQRILVVLPSHGFWFPEYVLLAEELRARPGVAVTVAATGEKTARPCPSSGIEWKREVRPGPVEADVTIDAVRGADFDAVVVLGLWPEDDIRALERGGRFAELRRVVHGATRAGRDLAGVAVGVRLLVRARVLDELPASRSKYINPIVPHFPVHWRDEAVVVADLPGGGRAVTAESYHDIPELVRRLLD